MNSQDLATHPVTKRLYSTPKLERLGSVERLSLGGTGTVAEGMAGTDVMKHP